MSGARRRRRPAPSNGVGTLTCTDVRAAYRNRTDDLFITREQPHAGQEHGHWPDLHERPPESPSNPQRLTCSWRMSGARSAAAGPLGKLRARAPDVPAQELDEELRPVCARRGRGLPGLFPQLVVHPHGAVGRLGLVGHARKRTGCICRSLCHRVAVHMHHAIGCMCTEASGPSSVSSPPGPERLTRRRPMAMVADGSYAAEVSALDCALDLHIAELRRRQDAGEVGPREAAALRVELLEAHLRAVKALRAQWFGANDV